MIRSVAVIVVGVDPHKFLLRAEALDGQGKSLGSWEGKNAADAYIECVAWVQSLGNEVCVGIEGAYGFGRGLGRALVSAELVVFDINPRWTAAYRRTARRSHKNDSYDARAAALVVLRDGEDLPRFLLDEAAVTLDLLTAERDSHIAEMTRRRNRLHAHLGALNLPVRGLSTRSALLKLQEGLPASAEGHDRVLLEVVHRHIARLLQDHAELDRLTKEVEQLAAEHYGGLTEIVGVGLVTAAVLAAELGAPSRFTSDAQLAAYTGVAPIEASSAGGTRHRLNRGGNRRLNAVFYRIALTQCRTDPRAHAYIARRRAEGRTAREALRCLKRYIARAVFQAWRRCRPLPCTPSPVSMGITDPAAALT